MKFYFFLLIFFLFIACSEQAVEFESFLDRLDQNVTERTVIKEFQALNTVNLTDYDLYSLGGLVHNSTHLFAIDFAEANVIKISKSNPDEIEIWELTRGEGPGEVEAIQSIAADDNRVYVGDPRSMRITEFDTDGNFINLYPVDFSPGNFVLTGGGKLVNQSPVLQPDLFVVFEPDADSLYGFEEGQIDLENSMKYAGYLAAGSETLFFAGYSEPVLRSYTIDGELIFSRSTIDNVDTRNNYEDRSTENFRAFGFSEDAKYSTFRIHKHDGRLFTIPFHNRDENFKYIDMYDIDTGDYTSSYRMDVFPSEVIIDNSHIFTVSRQDEDLKIKVYNL